MTRYLLFVVLFLLAGYGLVEAQPIIAGPSLSILSPKDNAPYPTGMLSVSGSALRAATLTLNDAPLPHHEDGSFAVALTLPRGGSILTFEAADRFGRRVTATRNVFVPF